VSSKSMSYDHPAYTSVATKPIAIAAGSGAASSKFVAFAAKLVKSVTLKPTTAGTSGDIQSLIQISGTTTTTVALGTIGSGVTTATQYQPTAAQNQAGTPYLASLNQGDTYYVVKGTDATMVLAGELEEVILPGANVTL
jgi:hypothetical protein